MVGMQTKEYKLPSKVEDLEIEFSKHMDSLGEMWCLCAREWRATSNARDDKVIIKNLRKAYINLSKQIEVIKKIMRLKESC